MNCMWLTNIGKTQPNWVLNIFQKLIKHWISIFSYHYFGFQLSKIKIKKNSFFLISNAASNEFKFWGELLNQCFMLSVLSIMLVFPHGGNSHPHGNFPLLTGIPILLEKPTLYSKRSELNTDSTTTLNYLRERERERER